MADDVTSPGRTPKDTMPDIAGGGPQTPNLESRVATLEADVKDIEAILGRIEPMLARADERAVHFATKEDPALNTGALNTLAEKVTGSTGASQRRGPRSTVP